MGASMDEKPQSTARHVFLGAVFLAFVWVGLFIVLPAVTGKEGKLQEMQQRLEAAPDR
jgi:predicted secreted protein